MQTKFDTALEKAQGTHKNEKAEEEALLEFYLLFFDTTFYLPVAEEPKITASDSEFFPIIIEEEEGEALYFFDTEERLKEWAGEEKIYSLPLTGEDLLMTFGPERALILNPHLDQVKEFYPDEIEFLFETFFQDGEEGEDE